MASVRPTPLQLSAERPAAHRDQLSPQEKPLHQAQHRRSSRVATLRFNVKSQLVFRCIWLVILSLHVVDGLAALGSTMLYLYIADPINMWVFGALKLSPRYFYEIGYLFAIVAAIHGLEIARMVFYSIAQRQLVFGGATVTTKPSLAVTVHPDTSSLRTMSVVLTSQLSCVWNQLRRPWRALFARDGYFGLDGPLFEFWFQLREAIEICMQSYQAFALSRSVPRHWINHLAAISVVLNCLSTPLAHVMLRGKAREKQRRLVCLVLDLALDFSFSVVIPFCVLLPYWRAFDKSQGAYPPELLYDDVWYVNAVTEGRQLFVTSLPDFLSTLLPHFGILMCLYTLKTLVKHAPKIKPSVAGAAAGASQRHVVVSSATTDGPTINRQVLINTAFVLWGVAVAAVHLYAQSISSELQPGCKLQLSPWFASNHSCSVMEVNCYRQNITGEEHQVAAILNKLQRESLLTLLLTHCPNLHVPPVIQQFPRLSGVEIFNCSVTKWSFEAAIRSEYHELMNYAFVMFSNVTAIPAGFLHRDLPAAFSHLYFLHTNVSHLPEDIDSYWGSHEWVMLGFEHCGLREIPRALGKLPMWQLVLSGNAIEEIPDPIFRNQRFITLDLSNNPLKALPSTIGDTSELRMFNAQDTQITSAPEWLLDWFAAAETSQVSFDVLCSDTPLCGGTNVTNVSASSAAAPALAATAAALVEKLCASQKMHDPTVEIVLRQRIP